MSESNIEQYDINFKKSINKQAKSVDDVGRLLHEAGGVPGGVQEVHAVGKCGQGDAGSVEVGRHFKNCLLRQHEQTASFVRHGGKLPAVARLAQSPRRHGQHHHFLHQRKSSPVVG